MIINCSICNSEITKYRLKQYAKNTDSNYICGKCYMKSDDFKIKQKVRMLELYNNTDYKNKIMEKRKKTNYERYGFEWANQDNNIINKQKVNRLKTLNKRYNVDNIMSIKEVKEKASANLKNTIINKYGFSNVMKVESIKEKAIKKQAETNYNRYGVRNKMQIKEFAKQHMAKVLEIKKNNGTLNNKKPSKSFKFFWNKINMQNWKDNEPKFMANNTTKQKILDNRFKKYCTRDLNEIKSKKNI